MSSILVVLSAFLTLTTSQSLGDPAFLSSYPPCAAQCQVEIINGPSNPCAFTTTANLTCQCAAANRAATAGCEKVSCSPAEYSTTQTLAEELCGPLYANGSLSASPVTAAIASATAAADAAIAGKDPTNSNDYPACGTACQQQTLPGSGCGSLANTACVCGEGPLNASLAACEVATCSREDLQTITYLAYRLCRSQGGIGNASVVANQTVATQTAGSVPMGPTMGTTPFTGGVAGMGAELGGWVVLAMVAGAVGWVA